MKKLLALVALTSSMILAGSTVAAAASSTGTGTATVPADTTIAAGHDAALAAAKPVCAKSKQIKNASIVVGAGSTTVTYTIKCSDVAKAAAVTTTTVAKAPPGPLFTQSGSGTATTSSFKVPSSWDLAWSYDCTQFLGGQGNFAVTIYDDYGQNSSLDFDNQGVNQLGATGQGVEHYHSGGNTKFLKILSECPWTVTVTKP